MLALIAVLFSPSLYNKCVLFSILWFREIPKLAIRYVRSLIAIYPWYLRFQRMMNPRFPSLKQKIILRRAKGGGIILERSN